MIGQINLVISFKIILGESILVINFFHWKRNSNWSNFLEKLCLNYIKEMSQYRLNEVDVDKLEDETSESEDEKYFSNVLTMDNLSTLENEQSLTSEIDNKEKSMSYLRQTNTWKWCYCCSSICNLILVSLIILFFVQYLFLQTPFVRVASIKMLNQPVEPKLNLEVEIQIYNPNVVKLEIDQIQVYFSVNSDKNDNNPISFVYERQPLIFKNRTFADPLSTKIITLQKSINIERRAQTLILTYQYSLNCRGYIISYPGKKI